MELGLRKATLAVDTLPLNLASQVTLFKNLPDSGRHVTSEEQGLFRAKAEEKRKGLGYEVDNSDVKYYFRQQPGH